MSRRATRPRIAARVVLDTNIVVSALVFRGVGPSTLRKAWQARAFQPLASTVTAHELMRVLAYPKFRLSPTDQHELLADYLPYAASVTVPEPAPRVPRCRDSFDQCFLELAIAGKAHVLVTGDNDLLALAAQFPVPVIGLARFLEGLKG
ncbi:putative toxin-antitoxin system toxin component, PIN family [soil metagenome]